jgi:putative ABC transport system substrate-binding protein
LIGCHRWRRGSTAISIRVDTLVLVCFLVLTTASIIALFSASTHAQQQPAERVYKIGFLRQGQPSDRASKVFVEAFQLGLRERGYVDGQNVVVESRFGPIEQLPQLAEELVRLKVDVIVASASSAAVPARKATASIPIVFATVNHPVEIGLIASLRRPGGNLTGTAFNSADLAGKRLELLRELVPTLKHVTMLTHPAHPTYAVQLKGAQDAARALGMEFKEVPIRGSAPADFEAGFKAVAGADGLLHADTPLFTLHRARFAELAAKSRLPVMHGYREMVDAGGLISYGPHVAELHRGAAAYVDKILKGATPGDLPVEQPTRFELVINSRTAKVLGLTMPRSILLRADQVLE